MATITLRVNEQENKFIKDYVKINNYNLSSFIRDVVLDRIEDDLKVDEKKILSALRKSKNEKTYSHNEVWEELGL
jgi:uncharacterized protein (DUF1778 family)